MNALSKTGRNLIATTQVVSNSLKPSSVAVGASKKPSAAKAPTPIISYSIGKTLPSHGITVHSGPVGKWLH
jgi:hypothetical protein